MSVLDWFKRNSDRNRGKPDPNDDHHKHHFDPADPPPGIPTQFKLGPCLRCGEWAICNPYMFCMPCWTFAADLGRWGVETKNQGEPDGTVVEVSVVDWAMAFAAKFPRDPGDPKAPTFPDTIVPEGSYWQPEGGKPNENGVVRGICSCHFFMWN